MGACFLPLEIVMLLLALDLGRTAWMWGLGLGLPSWTRDLDSLLLPLRFGIHSLTNSSLAFRTHLNEIQSFADPRINLHYPIPLSLCNISHNITLSYTLCYQCFIVSQPDGTSLLCRHVLQSHEHKHVS